MSLLNVPPTRTLLQVLREDLNCTGTKEGCSEGDCGACTVVLGKLTPVPAGLTGSPGLAGSHESPDPAARGCIKYITVNSCIRMAHAIDGMALWTVEDLASQDGSLHPAQQAMVACHGSQCGFCTPGFVMSLFGPVLTVQDALKARHYALPPVFVKRGDAAAALARSPHTLSGTLDVGGQEHFYLEGQVAYVLPQEQQQWLVHSSTQHPGEVQHWVAHALGLDSHAVRVECRRMGGGFGGKETQAGHVAVWAAIAAHKLQRPIKLRLDRDDDFMITGKRHPFAFEPQKTATASMATPPLCRNTTHYGMQVEDNILLPLLLQIERTSKYRRGLEAVFTWNKRNSVIKRGIALTPVKFGISFTATLFNQAGALVHVYTDGSVQVNHGGTEMGQGLNTKVCQIVADELGVPLQRVLATASDTSKIPNASATAASAGTDLNGRAAQFAARHVRDNLAGLVCGMDGCAAGTIRFEGGQVTSPKTTRTFEVLVKLAYANRIQLWSDGSTARPKSTMTKAR